MKLNKTIKDFEFEFEEFMDDALDSLSPKMFDKFKEFISDLLKNYD